jgi:hypothetical protein
MLSFTNTLIYSNLSGERVSLNSFTRFDQLIYNQLYNSDNLNKIYKTLIIILLYVLIFCKENRVIAINCYLITIQ